MDTKINPLNLIFVDSDWTEEFMLDEVLTEYQPDTWNLQPGDTVLEIGGHTGEVSMTLAKKYGVQVFVFEPSPQNYRKLMANIHANDLDKLITVFPLAVTGDGRDVHMHMVKNSGAHRIYGSKAGPVIKSRTLKQALEMCNLEKPPRVIVMDCEGAEFEILKDLEVLRGVEIMRGELHESFGAGDIDRLLAEIKVVVPDAIFTMTYIIPKV
jgi:FkbM family methyltransferase